MTIIHRIFINLLLVSCVKSISALTVPGKAANTTVCFPGHVVGERSHRIGDGIQVPVKIRDQSLKTSQLNLPQDGFDQTHRCVGPRQVRRPRSLNELRQHVKEAFYDRLPQYFVPRPDINLVNIKQVWSRVVWGGPHGWSRWVHFRQDLFVPRVRQCHPRLSGMRTLGEGISCPSNSAKECTYTRSVTLSSSYSNKVGVKIAVKTSWSAGQLFASASLDVSAETSYEHTWTDTSTVGNQYTFHIKPGNFCVPSEIHVDLECDVIRTVYWFDVKHYTAAGTTPLEASLSYGYHRNGGPYEQGQYCRYVYVREEVLSLDGWRVIEGDYFGYAWSKDNDLLKPYLKGGVAPKGNLAYIKKGNWDEGKKDWIFECSPLEWISNQASMTIPMEGESAAFQGMVSCVGSE